MLFHLTPKKADRHPPSQPTQRLQRRRTIGVALGAGSALGWAHIGILRELADHGIIPEIVAGTSIGAVVGAAYAAGKLDHLEAFARSLNRRRVFSLMDLSFAGTSLINGGRLKRHLERDLAGLSVESLALPFAAVATEMTTGHEIWLNKGDLVDCLRASYALPGIFEPIYLDGRWLFDGALVNPVPVSVCRSLGADIVIGINLIADIGNRLPPGANTNMPPRALSAKEPSVEEVMSTIAVEPMTPLQATKQKRRRRFVLRRLFTRRENGAPGIATVMMDAFTISQDKISRSRLAIDPPDVMINARLTSCGLFDFHRASELIAHGRAAVRRAMPEIEATMAASLSGRG